MLGILRAVWQRFLRWRDKPFTLQELEDGFAYMDQLGDFRLRYEANSAALFMIGEALDLDPGSAKRLLALWQTTSKSSPLVAERCHLALKLQRTGVLGERELVTA